jgi:hypothetical protein
MSEPGRCIGVHSDSSCRYDAEVANAYVQERNFFLLSSSAVAVPYVPVFCMTALAFGYGAKLVRDGEIAAGAAVIQVFFGLVNAAEAFGEVCRCC